VTRSERIPCARRPVAVRALAGLALAALVACLPAGAQPPYRKLKYPPLRDLKLPAVERVELPNGLVLYLVEDHSLPKVEGYVLIRAGDRWEPPDKVGLAGVTGQVMRTGGTTSRPGEDIDRALENIGASVETSIDTTSATATLFTLPENLPLVLDILADLLRHPAIPDDKLELAKVQQRSLISRRNDDVGDIADREFQKLLYGAASPYARTTEYDTINAISRSDLVALHEQFFHPNRTLLGLWGDFQAAEAKALVERSFGDWPRRETPLPPVPAVSAQPRGSVNFIQKDDVNQTNLRIGHLGGRFDDPDYYALIVMAEILGGGLSSRMFRHVRSDLGLAYASFASWQARFDYPGVFYVRVDTKSESTVKAVNATLAEIRALTREPVTSEELRVAKEAILNSFVFNFDTTSEIVRRLMAYEYFGYPKDFLERFKANVEKVSVDDVLRVAQKHVHPSSLFILAVGRAQDFDQPLATLGEVRTLDIAIPPPAPIGQAPAGAATPESLERGRAVLANAVRGIGGLEALRAVRDLTVLIRGVQVTPQGDLSLTTKLSVSVAEGKMRRDVVIGPMGSITLIYDGEHAWQTSPAGARELRAEEVAQVRRSLARDLRALLLDASDGKRTVQYRESASLGESPVDIILVTDAENDGVELWVEQATGRVLKRAQRGASPFAGPVNEEQFYSDFRTVGGLTLPFKLRVLWDGARAREDTVESYEINAGLAPELFAREPRKE
jgi:predicted Zn-dependent peptidase